MKTALIVIDYQNDFVNGSLGFEQAKALDTIICDKMNHYLNEKQDILFTFDTHGTNYMDTQEGRHLPVPHCIAETEGWALYGNTASYLDKAAAVFRKETFGSLALAEFLKEQQYGQVELCGLVSNICVISNAVLAKAALPDAEIIVDASATASSLADLHEKALDVMQGLHITVTNRSI